MPEPLRASCSMASPFLLLFLALALLPRASLAEQPKKEAAAASSDGYAYVNPLIGTRNGGQ